MEYLPDSAPSHQPSAEGAGSRHRHPDFGPGVWVTSDRPPEQPAPTGPEVAERGVAVSITQRQMALELILNRIAGKAQRDKLPSAMHTDSAEKIEESYGDQTGNMIKRATGNAEEMKLEAWYVMYHKLGFKAIAAVGMGETASGKRETSETLDRFEVQYGAGKAKERTKLRKQLRTLDLEVAKVRTKPAQ